MAALVILLALSIWIFVIVRRERGGLLNMESGRGEEPGIRLVSSKRLGRGKKVYLLEINGQLFLMGTGGLELLGGVPVDRGAGRKTH